MEIQMIVDDLTCIMHELTDSMDLIKTNPIDMAFIIGNVTARLEFVIKQIESCNGNCGC